MSESSNPQQVDRRDVDSLWAWLWQAYGTGMNKFGESPPPLWYEELSKLDKQQLAYGVDCLKSGDGEYANYPPPLFAFIKICRGLRRYEAHTPLLEEPRGAQTPEIAEKYIRQMRETLKRNNQQ